MKHKIYIFISIFALLLLFGIVSEPQSVKALDTLINYPRINNQTLAFGMSLPDLIKYIYLFAMGIAGAVALTSILLGAIKYISAAGNSSKISDAKDQIFSAILGVVILLSSYLILYTINPDLVTIGLTLPQFDTSKINIGRDVYRCVCACRTGSGTETQVSYNTLPANLGNASWNEWGTEECKLSESFLAWQQCKETCEASDDHHHEGIDAGCARSRDPYAFYVNSYIQSDSQNPSSGSGCGGQ